MMEIFQISFYIIRGMPYKSIIFDILLNIVNLTR